MARELRLREARAGNLFIARRPEPGLLGSLVYRGEADVLRLSWALLEEGRDPRVTGIGHDVAGAVWTAWDSRLEAASAGLTAAAGTGQLCGLPHCLKGQVAVSSLRGHFDQERNRNVSRAQSSNNTSET